MHSIAGNRFTAAEPAKKRRRMEAQGIEAEIPQSPRGTAGGEELERIARSPRSGDAPVAMPCNHTDPGPKGLPCPKQEDNNSRERLVSFTAYTGTWMAGRA
jgi:hypothetical protein